MEESILGDTVHIHYGVNDLEFASDLPFTYSFPYSLLFWIKLGHLCFDPQAANMIRFLVDSYNKPVPAILEIPSKEHPYDPAHDSVLSRVKYLFSSESVASGRR